jgi:hypothetical protein
MTHGHDGLSCLRRDTLTRYVAESSEAAQEKTCAVDSLRGWKFPARRSVATLRFKARESIDTQGRFWSGCSASLGDVSPSRCSFKRLTIPYDFLEVSGFYVLSSRKRAR